MIIGRSPSLPVSTLLELLASQRKCGTLVVTAEGEKFHIDIVDGRIVHAVSDCMPLYERLGNILLQRGVICAEDLQTVLDSDEEGFLGAVLERQDFVTRDQLLEALEVQASLLFRRLFSHRKTEFRFYEGQPAVVGIQIEANVTMLLLEGARTADEFENKPETDWQDWLQ